MIAVARDWLPAEALRTPAIRTALEAVVVRWSLRWFGTRAAAIAAFRDASAGGAISRQGADWLMFAPGLLIDGRGEVQNALARHALHAPTDAVSSGNDARLIGDFAERIMRDLAGDLAGLLQIERYEKPIPGSPRKGESAVVLRLAPEPECFALEIIIECAALASLRKRQCAPFKPDFSDPVDMLDALGETVVPFDVLLGSARLSAREMTELVPDDIIIIDTKLASPIALVARGTGRPLGAATLSRDGDELRLQAIAFEGQHH
jgi:Type III flagellar switch regulator (C-ring) FliN C-term